MNAVAEALTVLEDTSDSAALFVGDRSRGLAGAAEPQGAGGAWEDSDGEGESWTPDKPQWELKELKPMHRNVASLFAQGMKNVEIAQLVGVTPQYVHMLLKQPLVKAYIYEMCERVGVRMEALFVQSVDVISETMKSGSEAGKLKAVRLQLEATKRIGRQDGGGIISPNTDRLEKLAERLLQLQTGVRVGHTFNQDGAEIQGVVI